MHNAIFDLLVLLTQAHGASFPEPATHRPLRHRDNRNRITIERINRTLILTLGNQVFSCLLDGEDITWSVAADPDEGRHAFFQGTWWISIDRVYRGTLTTEELGGFIASYLRYMREH
jgi:hypothetical protein